MTKPDCTHKHAHPGLDVGCTITDLVGISNELFQVTKGKVFQDEVEVLISGGEDGEKGYDVRVLELLKEFQFSDGIRGHALCVLFLYFDLLDGDEFRGIASNVTEEDEGVGTLTELLAWNTMVRSKW